jgi:hypothetical protein
MEQLLYSLYLIVLCAIVVFVVAAVWKTFVKAGQPGWAAIVPIYNMVIILRIAGKPIWWLLLMLIPLVNLIIGFIVYISFAKAFGKGTGFGVGLTLLGFIFFPILGFGDARYQGAPAQA